MIPIARTNLPENHAATDAVRRFGAQMVVFACLAEEISSEVKDQLGAHAAGLPILILERADLDQGYREMEVPGSQLKRRVTIEDVVKDDWSESTEPRIGGARTVKTSWYTITYGCEPSENAELPMANDTLGDPAPDRL